MLPSALNAVQALLSLKQSSARIAIPLALLALELRNSIAPHALMENII